MLATMLRSISHPLSSITVSAQWVGVILVMDALATFNVEVMNLFTFFITFPKKFDLIFPRLAFCELSAYPYSLLSVTAAFLLQ